MVCTEKTNRTVHSDLSLYLKAEAGHAGPVLFDHALAVLRRVRRRREEHTLVALGFLVFAHAARLERATGVSEWL